MLQGLSYMVVLHLTLDLELFMIFWQRKPEWAFDLPILLAWHSPFKEEWWNDKSQAWKIPLQGSSPTLHLSVELI